MLLDFLAAQIAGAIVDSIADARPCRPAPTNCASIGAALPASSAIAPSRRSSPTRKPCAPASSRARSLGATCPDGTTQGCPRYLAVDPALQLVEILREGQPRALLLFFAVHPTSITHDADLYSGDLAGIACATLEKDRAPVAGFFNGAEGDISPDWLAQDRDDAIRLAGRLAASAARLLESGKFQADPNPQIEVRRKTVANNWRDTDGIGFASQPMAGAAEPGGAEDGRTIFYNYGWRAEARKPAPAGEHGGKEPGLDGPLAGAVESLDGNSLAKAVKVLRPARFLSPGIFPALVPVTWV